MGPFPHALAFSSNLYLKQQQQCSGSWIDGNVALISSAHPHSKILILAFHSSISNRFQESGYKLAPWWYHTHKLLHSIYPSVPDSCWRRNASQADLLHIFWPCLGLHDFWTQVHAIIQKFTDRCIPKDPGIFLLHYNNISFKLSKKSYLIHLVNAARSSQLYEICPCLPPYKSDLIKCRVCRVLNIWRT